MKHLFKLAILIFGLLLFTYACQKEDITSQNLDIKNTTISYKKLALSDIEKLQPVVNNIKKLSPKITDGMQAKDFSFLSLDSLDTENIIEYTDTTGYSTWTFKINGNTDSINFENLHLLETDEGYIGYILSYEPDVTWFYSNDNMTPEGDWVLHMENYQGYITKYSLERELIWSSNPATQNASNRKVNSNYERNGATTICTISAIQSCITLILIAQRILQVQTVKDLLELWNKRLVSHTLAVAEALLLMVNQIQVMMMTVEVQVEQLAQ